jgi:sec-independent protein translocase protein TatB
VIDLGLAKMLVIGGIALVFIGPEKLPRVARTVGTLLGKAQRYVADVKAEVNRSMELDELRKMKDTMESAARDVESSVRTHATDFQSNFESLDGAAAEAQAMADAAAEADVPIYRRPDKNWRLKRGSTPVWYKARAGVRTHAQSGAARVARFRPKKSS